MSSKSDSKDWPLPKPSFAEEYSILYQIARYEAHDRETAWYGVYNLALISLIERSWRNTEQSDHQSEQSLRHSERTQRRSEPAKQPPPSKDVILALVSQPPLTEVRSENTIVSDGMLRRFNFEHPYMKELTCMMLSLPRRQHKYSSPIAQLAS